MGDVALKQIAEQASNLVTEMQMIAGHLEDYNPGLSKDKVPLFVLQHDLACLGEDLIRLYSKIERKIKKD